jgi:hypothetical protein
LARRCGDRDPEAPRARYLPVGDTGSPSQSCWRIKPCADPAEPCSERSPDEIRDVFGRYIGMWS